MAVVYKKAAGYKIQKLVGMHEDVQQRMDEVAHHVRQRAVRILAQHEDQGHAFIEPVSSGTKLPDRYIVLNDTRGMAAAMTIEFGRGPSYSDQGALIHPGHDPVAPLRRAAQIPWSK